MESYLYSVKEG